MQNIFSVYTLKVQQFQPSISSVIWEFYFWQTFFYGLNCILEKVGPYFDPSGQTKYYKIIGICCEMSTHEMLMQW